LGFWPYWVEYWRDSQGI